MRPCIPSIALSACEQCSCSYPLRASLQPRHIQAFSRRNLVVCQSAHSNSDLDSSTSSTNGIEPSIPSSTNGSRGFSFNGHKEYGALKREDFNSFVQFFRQASPYIEGHRGSTFVVVIPGEVIDDKDCLYSVLEDVALLHGLGARLVLVLGARVQINTALRQRGDEPKYHAGMRITDHAALHAAIQAAGSSRMEVEAYLSKGPAVQMVRRHTRSTDRIRYGPALQTVSGNYVAAKRKGVIDGVDFGYTGSVRFVQGDVLRKHLDDGHIVLLSNMGFSAGGEVLNCHIYGVGVRAAVDLQADKLFCLTLPETQPLELPPWMPIGDAKQLLEQVAQSSLRPRGRRSAFVPDITFTIDEGDRRPLPSESESAPTNDDDMDFDRWHSHGVPAPLIAAYTACEKGVKRSHLVDARVDGALLLELYSRDGIGTMISTDFYEGLRPAQPHDLSAIEALLQPLEDKGILAPRSREQLLQEIPLYMVAEREAKVLGCVMLRPLGKDADGGTVAELGAFCVHPDYRGAGRGDSMLEYCEQRAKASGVTRLVLLTTRTAAWFEQRGFVGAGPAHDSQLLPPARRAQVNRARNSQLYVKSLVDETSGTLGNSLARAGTPKGGASSDRS